MSDVMGTLGKMLGAFVLFGISKFIIFMPPIGSIVGLIFIIIAFMLLWSSYTSIKTLFMSVINGKSGFRDYDGNEITRCPQVSMPDDYIDPGLVPQAKDVEFDTIHHVRKNTTYTKKSNVPKMNAVRPVDASDHAYPVLGSGKPQPSKKALNVARNASHAQNYEWTDGVPSRNHRCATAINKVDILNKLQSVSKKIVRTDGPSCGKRNK